MDTPLNREAWQAIALTLELASLTTVLLLILATPLARAAQPSTSACVAPGAVME